ncbi:hypothetical protein [Aureimonas altamirensis]|nr:hypothetical protein [Aureimonas altamirensis]
MARLKGQTITTVVERAIFSAAASESVPNRGYDGWQDFWDVNEGARAINVAREPAFFPTFEEEKRLAFCEEHWPFFFANSDKSKFRYAALSVLWPRIDEFVEAHETGQASDYWGAGKAMQKALTEANIQPPEWPLKKTKPSPDPSLTAMDDEIPF